MRGIAAIGVALLALLGSTATAPAVAEPAPRTGHGGADPAEAVYQAARILTPDDEGTGDTDGEDGEDGHVGHHHDGGPHVELTLAMRDLFLARPRLGFLDAVRADLLLARPTDGNRDPGGDGYRGESDRRCGRRICVHYARRGVEAPDSERWVGRTLRTLSAVWSYEVGTLGLRRPPYDGRKGGDGRFDVYLADLGNRGLFGYCTPERRVPGERFSASGYCVLDDDFARDQYGAAPRASLRVTAAHEFFHAIQFGYDFREDPWLLESTATWVEERFADGADDNRRYLRFGSVRRPGVSLDHFSNSSYAHYGNWAFWEFLTRRYGASVVPDVWARADARSGAPDDYSVRALARVLRPHGGLRSALASYAAANLDPGARYPEGERWPRAAVEHRLRLSPSDRATRTLEVDHLAAGHLLVRPARDAPRRRAVLEIAVAGPPRESSPAVLVTVRRRDGSVARHPVALGRAGDGRARIAFGSARASSVVVTAVNASRRYRCDRHTLFACAGTPVDQDRRFVVTARVIRRP